ncbi:hypothetical protein SSTU70S_05757 [Stutzerimonas stutzeri]
MARLKEIYRKEIAPKLKEELQLANVMEVPRITKITLNMGIGEAIGDKKIIDNAVADLEKITGQKVVVTHARKSIAGFKVREGWPIGVKVTLRRERMYEFLDRLLSISLPRVRDFRGLNAKFEARHIPGVVGRIPRNTGAGQPIASVSERRKTSSSPLKPPSSKSGSRNSCGIRSRSIWYSSVTRVVFLATLCDRAACSAARATRSAAPFRTCTAGSASLISGGSALLEAHPASTSAHPKPRTIRITGTPFLLVQRYST